MAAPAFSVSTEHSARLANPALREGLLKFARRRLPPGQVDDLVQSTLLEALASRSAPSGDADFRRWLHGIARHKIADLYRRQARFPKTSSEADATVVDPGPGTGELTQWIERELPNTPDAKATLGWLLRESEGETLDEIARDAALPAPRVRQRVSRLRRHFQTRWLALGAAGLALLLGLAIGLRVLAPVPPTAPSIAREPVTPLDRAHTLRQKAFEHCAMAEYPRCLAGLDEAKDLDPIGDRSDAVQGARTHAQDALRPEPAQVAPAPKSNAKSTPKQKAAPKHLAPKTQPRPNKKPSPLFDVPSPQQSNQTQSSKLPAKN